VGNVVELEDALVFVAACGALGAEGVERALAKALASGLGGDQRLDPLFARSEPFRYHALTMRRPRGEVKNNLAC
jgi:hypothetical protein